MLATLAEAPLCDPGLVYEPKYDGIRAIVTVTPANCECEIEGERVPAGQTCEILYDLTADNLGSSR